MNLTQAIFLANANARGVRGNYEPHLVDDTYVNSQGKKITNALFKTLDKTIKVSDLCVVPTGTRHGFTVIKVIEVDVSIDFDDKTPMEWIVAKIDLSGYNELVKQEEELKETIRKAEMEVRRANLANALNLGDGIKSLPLANA